MNNKKQLEDKNKSFTKVNQERKRRKIKKEFYMNKN